MSTWINDLKNNCVVEYSIKPAAIAATTVGSAVDCNNCEGPMALIIPAGTVTDGEYTPSITESETSGGTYTAVTPHIGTFAAITTANDETTYVFGFKRTKRYVKVTLTETSAGSTGIVAAAILVGQKKAI